MVSGILRVDNEEKWCEVVDGRFRVFSKAPEKEVHASDMKLQSSTSAFTLDGMWVDTPCAETAAAWTDALRNASLSREDDLLRRERDLAHREANLLWREHHATHFPITAPLRSPSPPSPPSPRPNVYEGVLNVGYDIASGVEEICSSEEDEMNDDQLDEEGSSSRGASSSAPCTPPPMRCDVMPTPPRLVLEVPGKSVALFPDETNRLVLEINGQDMGHLTWLGYDAGRRWVTTGTERSRSGMALPEGAEGVQMLSLLAAAARAADVDHNLPMKGVFRVSQRVKTLRPLRAPNGLLPTGTIAHVVSVSGDTISIETGKTTIAVNGASIEGIGEVRTEFAADKKVCCLNGFFSSFGIEFPDDLSPKGNTTELH